MSHLALLILRITFGATMLWAHGMSKLLGFSDKMDVFPDPLGIGSQTSLALTVFAEVLCSLFQIIGLKTRLVSIPLFICMLVAVFIIHGGDPWKSKELGLVYLYAYGALIAGGSGKYSVDALLAKNKGRPEVG
ncbi:MAG: DoxX family protein [Bacteriovoracaceae bacterium]